MATIPLTVPDAQIDRIADAYGWNAVVGKANLPGETKAQFIRRVIAEQIKFQVRSAEANARNAAAIAALPPAPTLDVT